jgi:hypothetical protein
VETGLEYAQQQFLQRGPLGWGLGSSGCTARRLPCPVLRAGPEPDPKPGADNLQTGLMEFKCPPLKRFPATPLLANGKFSEIRAHPWKF